jgi:hypothetical protein
VDEGEEGGLTEVYEVDGEVEEFVREEVVGETGEVGLLLLKVEILKDLELISRPSVEDVEVVVVDVEEQVAPASDSLADSDKTAI